MDPGLSILLLLLLILRYFLTGGPAGKTVPQAYDFYPPPAEAKFLDEIRTKVLRVFLLAIHSHLY
jgi:hypothetical protein